MAMTASHGWWCNTVTFPTQCRSCGEQVFFFRCDHGSAVFFDALGEPWPEHDCETSWARNLPRWMDSSGGINAELSPNVTVRRPPEGAIDAAVAAAAKRRQQRPDPIKAIKPDDKTDTASIVGVLCEKETNVNVAKALKLPNVNTMAAASLGSLSKGNWGRITVHVPSPKEDVLHSYTAWVPAEALSAVGTAKDVMVVVGLRSQFVLGKGHIWVCSNYEVIG